MKLGGGRIRRTLSDTGNDDRALRRDAELFKQRPGVVGVVAEPLGDLLARRLGAFGEEAAQEVAGVTLAPPRIAEAVAQERAQLRRAHPGAQVVGGVEA